MAKFIRHHLPTLKEKTILVVTSKIVALAQGRVRTIHTVAEKNKLIKQESQWAQKTKYTWLTVKDGILLPAAGVDESNADGKIILLPSDPEATARKLCRQLKKLYHVKNLGIIITDSRITMLRAGTVGIAIGYSGFKGIRDYRGKPDIFGRKLKISRANLADGLATAAVMVMGEGDETSPLATIEEAPVVFTDKINTEEIKIPLADDLFAPILKKVIKIKQ